MNGKFWTFTLNNPTPADAPLTWDVKYLSYQKERGEEGTVHYQGYIELHKNKRLSGVRNQFSKTAHWETRKGTQEQAIAYTQKEDTRIDGPWVKGVPRVKNANGTQGTRTDLEEACVTAAEEGLSAVMTKHPVAYVKYHAGMEKVARKARRDKIYAENKVRMEAATLRTWQTALLDKVNEEPDDRKISWYWEDTGNVGKTWMAKYLMAIKGATILSQGKYADLTYMLKDHVGSVVVFNLTRQVEDDKINHLYSLCEAIKDDVVISTKYECQHVPLGKQHVIVFANKEPDYEKWSSDRYDVHQIKDGRTDSAGAARAPLATAR